ncbi:hypothetical protein J437_LFUL008564 [Ladona fulva]|uniref:Uncharacterized protein n=1 Tax=Ladona fulva TaxID=123851 RepID=A0A8K0P1F7_LADFU|nr:hypothetical protein J437_LFUL008564 [Ladona fulva]
MPEVKDSNASISHDASNKNTYKPYKSRKSFARRKGEVESIMKKFPTKIPVVIERYHKETNLPLLDKTKFLVPQEITMSQFVTIIRKVSHVERKVVSWNTLKVIS